MKFRPIMLEDKEVFDSFVKGRHYMQSEASFANLYIWQHAWDVKIAVEPGALFVSFDSDVYRPFLIPPFLMDESESIEPYMLAAEQYMDEHYHEFYMKCATSEMVEKIKRDTGKRYIFRYDRDNADYVYNTEDLENLAGKKYHGKRNHISGFLRNHMPAVALYGPHYRDQCLLLQEEWAKSRGEDRAESDGEYISIVNALDNFEALDLQGLVVLLETKVAAFSIGEFLNDDTALIHIEKADPKIPGLFPYINQQFVQRVWRDTKYINREEDMGIPGLRQAKQSYRPAFLVDKFDVIRAGDR